MRFPSKNDLFILGLKFKKRYTVNKNNSKYIKLC